MKEADNDEMDIQMDPRKSFDDDQSGSSYESASFSDYSARKSEDDTYE